MAVNKVVTGTSMTIEVQKVTNKAGITEVQTNALMDTIIAKNIFLTATGALASKESAQLTERKITKYTIA